MPGLLPYAQQLGPQAAVKPLNLTQRLMPVLSNLAWAFSPLREEVAPSFG
jgi:hypothetical protein